MDVVESEEEEVGRDRGRDRDRDDDGKEYKSNFPVTLLQGKLT